MYVHTTYTRKVNGIYGGKRNNRKMNERTNTNGIRLYYVVCPFVAFAMHRRKKNNNGGRAEGNRNSTTAVIKKYVCPLGAVFL
jgi:hypothetical protein